MCFNGRVQLRMDTDLAAAYKSGAQRTRVISEHWAGKNLYCPCCPSDSLESLPNNREAIDYACSSCQSFQLKSCKATLGKRIVDGSFAAMSRAILAGSTPNLLTLRYDPFCWEVRELLLLPHFAFTLSCIEERVPLWVTARRARWVGCNILLRNIPVDVRICMVAGGKVVRPSEVRRKFRSMLRLQDIRPLQRGWTLDVLNVVRRIGKQQFSLAEVYDYAGELENLHPDNRHVHDKIRQQLQVLRDLGFLDFSGQGTYHFRTQPPPS
jgi:type II restriction enzyme